ncbi:4-alpha-glucanotransferase [Anaerococcus lactolyticus]|uniref:4-alpha-glucanotransferase n=1 Tax=Anaerococcus lactolyticus TaxID=33032 RepID=UPI00288C3727|nr:4-alpha-glucanotransferase [Anaerococcus lactolyticus]
MEKAGILWPLASLNGNHGIGDFGKASYDFIDISKKAGFDMWQILPLNPLGYGNSPYQPYSSYAGDEVYISLDMLYEDGLLDEKVAPLKQEDRVDYNFVRDFKGKYLKKAYEKFKEKGLDKTEAYKEFLKFDFVYDYAVFISFKKDNDLIAWNEWPKEQKSWIIDRKLDLSPYEEQIGYEIFVQYIFYVQWMKLKAYANKNGLKIIGDIPFYVGLDSLDVWQNQKYFEITEEGKPILIAGVPPDAFSDLGQRWGNPIYKWDELEKDDFKFWIDRLAYNAKLYDIVRLDHFRAFDTYWQIDAKNDTAVEGEWIYAPGFKLFDKITEELNDVEFIAEDLGTMMPGVYKLRDHYDLKGMVIIQENLRPWEDHLVEARENSVAYPGTHDNKTLFQWYGELSDDQKESIVKYFRGLGIDNGDLAIDFFDYSMGLPSEYVIVSLGDILGFGEEARINEPSTLNDKNWSFKLKDLSAFANKEEAIRKSIEKNKACN